MTDRIEISGIEARGRHGVLVEEQETPQTFRVDVVVYLDLSRAGKSDELTDTIDYGMLAATIHEIVAKESHRLIEKVAERVAQSILAHAEAERVVVTVHKPEAPIGVPFADVSVTVDRRR